MITGKLSKNVNDYMVKRANRAQRTKISELFHSLNSFIKTMNSGGLCQTIVILTQKLTEHGIKVHKAEKDDAHMIIKIQWNF